jgi:dolichyl-diphosphooligosaccharide--protein glycosyltransferase
MKENTPDPFGDPDSYYGLYKSPPASENYSYPESAYGVLAWWDYGYWITRIAHRIPNANPSQDPRHITRVASFFTSQEETSVNETIQELGTAYVIVDYETALSKFWAIVTWAGKEESEFYDIYYEPQENQLAPRVVFYPEYYRTLSTRLYNFDGKAVTPVSSIVISFRQNLSQGGIIYKEITDVKQFGSYEEAGAYVSSQNSANYRIVSDNPFISPVPLEALEHYRLIYSSESQVEQPGVGAVPEVKIFEYVE